MSKRKHLLEPWFTLAKLGLKTIEARLDEDEWRDVEVGDVIEWYNYDFGRLSVFETCVTHKTTYASLDSLLRSESLQNVFPGLKSVEEAHSLCKLYYRQYSEHRAFICIKYTLSK